MREATGGALLIYLFIPIIVMIIIFVGFIMNYASAYRAANYVVTQIESCQGLIDDKSCSSFGDTSTMSQTIKSKYGYSGPMKIECISNGDNSVRRVTLGVYMDFPLIELVHLFDVKAETKTLRSSCS